jgi:N-acetylmuramoyl-L-alanine amidase
MRAFLAWVAVFLSLAAAAAAQDLTALARFQPAASAVRDARGGVELQLAISQPVPWRLRLLDNPPRLVVDTREVDWRGAASLGRTGTGVRDLRAGGLRPGWSRLVAELSGPMGVTQAGMDTSGGGAVIAIRLDPVPQPDFAERAARTDPADWALPPAADLPPPQARGSGPLVVVLDPGHGGIDPGAEREGQTEAALMLTFARELKDLFLRSGGVQIVLTRNDDVFVPLEERISIARAAGAHVLLSLHADALAEGEATGATLYTLAEDATDRAAEALAERHDRDDLLAGVDLTSADDLIAQVLMDMARTETMPRTDRLADALKGHIRDAGLAMHRHPRQAGAFSVLKAPDIPSVLIELGFLSSPRDFRRLTDAEWRARMAGAIHAAVTGWAAEDAALSALRQ